MPRIIKSVYCRAMVVVILCASTLPGMEGAVFFCGRMLDNSAQPVPGCMVRLGDSNSRFTTTDSLGCFCLDSLMPAVYSGVVAAPGFDTLRIPGIQVRHGSNDQFVLHLKRREDSTVSLQCITVYARPRTSDKLALVNSHTAISREELLHTAGSADDITRVIATLPSTVPAPSSGFDNTLLVRGGAADENISIIDGIEFESINHFSGFGTSGGQLSLINAALVSNASFFAGAIPADLPPRLSSATVITTRDGSTRRLQTHLDVNASGLGVGLEGPLPGKKASFLISGRAINFSFLKSWVPDIDQFPSYEDLYAKVSVPVGEKDKVSLTLIGSGDNHNEDATWFDMPMNDADKTMLGAGGLTWKHSGSRGVNRSTVSLVYRRQEGFRDLLDQQAVPQFGIKRWDAYNDCDTTVRFDERYTLYLGKNHLAQAGFCIEQQRVSFYQADRTITGVEGIGLALRVGSLDSIMAGSRRSETVGGFAQYIGNLGPFKIVGGLRNDYFGLLRSSGLSPRLGLTFKTSSNEEFSVSAGRYYQLPVYLRFSDPGVAGKHLTDFLPQRNMQAVVGYKKTLSAHVIEAESYGKWYDRELLHSTPDEPKISRTVSQTGQRRAAGMEIRCAKSKREGLYYAAGYSLFTVEDRYADGLWYNDNNNVRNTLRIALGKQMGSHFVSVSGFTSEGRPFTPMTVINEPGIYKDGYTVSSGFNKERRSPLLWLCLRYSYSSKQRWGTFSGYLDFMNVLNHTPVIGQRFDGLRMVNERLIGIVPVGGVTADF